MMASNIRVPHREAPLSEEEAAWAIPEALELIHHLIGGYSAPNIPDEVVARAHRFFSLQSVPGDTGCVCKSCLAVSSSLPNPKPPAS